MKHLPIHKQWPKAEQLSGLIGLENKKLEFRVPQGQGALGNTPVVLQQQQQKVEIKKGNTKGSPLDRRKIIPDGSMEKQKETKNDKKGWPNLNEY